MFRLYIVLALISLYIIPLGNMAITTNSPVVANNDSTRNIFENIRGSIYNAHESQTDNDPLVTADNSTISGDINSLRWCALSRDLLERWGGPISYGDTIYVESECDYAPEYFIGYWVVKDCMNSRYENSIDFLVEAGSYYLRFKHCLVIKY